MRLLIVANTDKPLVRPELQKLVPWLKQRVEVIGVEENCEGDWSDLGSQSRVAHSGAGDPVYWLSFFIRSHDDGVAHSDDRDFAWHCAPRIGFRVSEL